MRENTDGNISIVDQAKGIRIRFDTCDTSKTKMVSRGRLSDISTRSGRVDLLVQIQSLAGREQARPSLLTSACRTHIQA